MKKYIMWILLIAVLTISTLLSGGIFIRPENLLHLLRQVSLIAIVTTGQTLVILSGGIDLSVGSVVALSSIISVSSVNLGYSRLFVVFASLLIGGAFGIINALLVTRVGLSPFVSTLATMVIARGIAFVITQGSPQYMTPEGIERINIFGNGYLWVIPVPVIIMLTVFLVGCYLLYRTRLGQHIYAVGNNENTARLAGVSIEKTLLIVYGLCGLLAGLTGLIYASRLSYGNPAGAMSYNFDSIIPVVLGGAPLTGGEGSLINSWICVVILGMLSSLMNMLNVSPFVQDGVKGVILLAAVYFTVVKK